MAWAAGTGWGNLSGTCLPSGYLRGAAEGRLRAGRLPPRSRARVLVAPVVAPRGGVCVYERVQGAKPPHPLCPKTRLPLRLRDPRPLGGTRGPARLQPGSAPRPGPRSERRAPRPRTGLVRILGSLARRQPSGFAARAGDARCSRGRRPGRRPGRRATGTPRTRPSSPSHTSAPAALPAHTRSASPLPTSPSFQNPERPAARTRADYMAQGHRPRRNKMA
ncbi:uncharacterized protein LOC111150701 [Enhydra lutris kenyoni]|uniref:Uncharacterized protein LOC111150701 n=1 Tax=Enhydra lutris kenyoni TaxID=391180 RepID=A0A2Y9JSF9_ENHLU|nr:uncharacterized protein LOC111150701 [Enhydra lutris kenyoni]